jgi:hypothetical protein
MSKTTRKGFKISLPPFAEGWYEQTIEGIKEDIRKRSGKSLFKRSKNEVDLAGKFRNFLLVAEKDIEVQLWYAKGFAVRNDLGTEIDSDLSHLFSLTIGVFNKLLRRFNPNTLSEDLLNHLKRELKSLNEKAGRLWEIQSINPNSDPQAKDRAKRLIEKFRSDLWDFDRIMEPYLEKEETKETP